MKRATAIADATVIIQAIADRRIDPYEGWQQVCGIFQSSSGLGLPELKLFVRVENADANSSMAVTDEFREKIWSNALNFLARG